MGNQKNANVIFRAYATNLMHLEFEMIRIYLNDTHKWKKREWNVHKIQIETMHMCI